MARFINPKVGTNQPGCRVSREGGLQGWWRRKEGTNSNKRLVKSFEHNTSPLFQILQSCCNSCLIFCTSRLSLYYNMVSNADHPWIDGVVSMINLLSSISSSERSFLYVFVTYESLHKKSQLCFFLIYTQDVVVVEECNSTLLTYWCNFIIIMQRLSKNYRLLQSLSPMRWPCNSIMAPDRNHEQNGIKENELRYMDLLWPIF